MNTLTADEITALLASGGHKRQRANPKNYYYLSDGTRVTGKPPTESVGKFEGKAGSIRRSRKGATRRVANGQRFYNISPDSQIVAYKVAP